MSLYDSIVIPLSVISGLWIPCTLLCCIPWVQKQMLYLHWVTLFPGKWLTQPERAGYLKNQVIPFRIPTKDDERLFSWLIAPLGVYMRHMNDFIEEKPLQDDIEQTQAFKLLKEDPEARLVIYFHGNTGTVAQGRRTEEYRMYSSGASDKIFVLTFDYRGFGKSTGSPSESGLMNDAEAVIDWALNTVGISPDRIVFLGHSLGTAVATSITHYYANLASPIEFAGLILCASFTNTGSAFSSYAIADLIPVLAPLKLIPCLQTWFRRRFRDSWRTDQRLEALAKRSEKLNLVLVHAENDGTMPWDQTEELFKTTVRAATEGVGPNVRTVDLGEAGNQETWRQGNRTVTKLIAKHGGK
ncbi:alpha/beta-hydrolase [Bimuria novae-zelandiae CBS 107.79]|uniref:Alpha/beta-hydrolase n=1 Tax=Bimuria novae-zelandiae CBS 107.79 TaxID=1447943 RepID=A0A6A5UTJ6_9PLEO|nr:alpha/beta-hydrolase [Bimuria novae-zelandiae CBS 107.79]